ncbi:MAG: polysaccharide ABC transporter ATP-binding protein [Planctomycetota bacterium]
MSTIAIQLTGVGKMYKLYRRPADKVMDALGVSRFVPGFESRYREFWALRGLDLTIGRGERLGIIGRNGSGKSTMLKVISGNVPATEGMVTVHGNVQALMELGTGFHPEFTGRENIRASLAYHGLSSRRIGELEEEIIDFTELEEFIDQPVKTYSAGMYARLAFSTATSIEPEILIIDEVLGAGDAYFSGKCVERMKRLTEGSGATVLFVSHDLGSVQQLCERVIWVDRGQIALDGTPIDVTKAYYASIVRQEELRLKARNARLSRRDMKAAAAREEAEHAKEVLLRFVTNNGQPPSQCHAIKRIRLTCGADWREEIVPGAPMDNDASHAAYLMTDRKYMLWSEPEMVHGHRVRSVTATGGQYGHAPFVFVVPAPVWNGATAELEIEHATSAGDVIQVEEFTGEGYRVLGRLEESSGRWSTQMFALGGSHGSTKAPVAAVTQRNDVTNDESASSEITLRSESRERFYSQYASFRSIQLTAEGVGPTSIFAVGQAINIVVEMDVQREIAQCAFSYSIYLPDNTVVAIGYWPIAGGLRVGTHTWTVSLVEPNLRQNEYIMSCVVMKETPLLTNRKYEYYCQWHRAITFRIDEGRVGSSPHGVVMLRTDPAWGASLNVRRLHEAVQR